MREFWNKERIFYKEKYRIFIVSQILEPRESRKIVSLLLTAPCAIIFTANPPLLGPSRTAGFKGSFGFDIKVWNFILKMILSYNKFLLKYCKIVFDVILILVKVISLLCWAILWFIDYKINAYSKCHISIQCVKTPQCLINMADSFHEFDKLIFYLFFIVCRWRARVRAAGELGVSFR